MRGVRRRVRKVLKSADTQHPGGDCAPGRCIGLRRSGWPYPGSHIATQGAEVSATSALRTRRRTPRISDTRGVTGTSPPNRIPTRPTPTSPCRAAARWNPMWHVRYGEPRTGCRTRGGQQKVDQASSVRAPMVARRPRDCGERVARQDPLPPYGCWSRPPSGRVSRGDAVGYLQDHRRCRSGGQPTPPAVRVLGYHMGVVGPGEVCSTSSTETSTGPDGQHRRPRSHGVTATVAASAITGYITDQGVSRHEPARHRPGMGLRGQPEHGRDVPGVCDEDGSARGRKHVFHEVGRGGRPRGGWGHRGGGVQLRGSDRRDRSPHCSSSSASPGW